MAFRMARLGPVAAGAMRSVESAIHSRLGTLTETTAPKGGGGVRSLARLLNSTDRDVEKSILEGLSSQSPELAEEVRALMFMFDDIVTLDDRAVQRVLSEVDTKTLAVALKGVDEGVKGVLLRNMSQRARDLLLEELDLLGPTARGDVEAARAKVAAVVRHLADEDEIVIHRGGAVGSDIIE